MQENDLKGRAIAHYFWDEIEKIAEGPVKHAPLVKEEEKDQITEVRRIKDTDITSPGKMFGVQISKHIDGKAKMSPMILPVPGYTFNPEMQKWVPNMSDPGWITTGNEMIARAKREGYIQAKKEEILARMQTEASSFIENTTGGAEPRPEGMDQPEQTQPTPAGGQSPMGESPPDQAAGQSPTQPPESAPQPK